MTVAVVTDSTAYLPASIDATDRLTVVPLTVVVNGEQGLEGVEISPAEVARALTARRHAVHTSRPSPEQFTRAYRDLLDGGADGIVSVHLSARLSGTYDAARLAAGQLGERVVVVDSRTTGMGLGFVALAAADAADAGGDLTAVHAAATDHTGRVSTFFYVDTLEYLRRGGRVGTASALLGTALSVKPILHVQDGAIVVRDKVRTAGRALARLVDLAVEAAGGGEVDVAVHHLGSAERAGALADAVSVRLGERLRDCHVAEIGAVVGAHVGPGVVGVVIHRRGG